MRSKPSEITRRRRGERGAALIMSLLVAMLLLAAGGVLIATAGMTASNAVDATAEVQAYYAADAGLQAALTVLRRNRAVAAGQSALAANFHTFACGSAAACTNGGNDLSQWLGPMPKTLGTNLTYTITVSDPGKSSGASLAANYIPRYLVVRSVGRGPRGAVKVMEMMLDDYAFDFTARAAVALHSHDTDNVGMSTFSIGESAPHLWNGNDLAGLAPNLAAFAVTNTADYDAGDGFGPKNGTPPNAQGVAESVISNDGGNVIGASQLKKLSNSELDWWLKDAMSARVFLTQMRAKAVSANRFFTSDPGDIGTDASPKFTFIDGDIDLTGKSDSGAGLMIVTGKYTQKGSASFHGLVLALGEGIVERNGTPGLAGALVLAKFQHNWDALTLSYTGTGGFGAPSLSTSGGGNSLVGYNSDWVRRAMESLGSRVVGIVEK